MASPASIYVAKRASNLANPTSASVFVQADDSSRAAFVLFEPPVGSSITNARFRVRARGRFTTGTTSNAKATIQFSSNCSATAAATATNNTDAFALTNRSLASITRPWSIDCEFIWDSTSQRLSGQANGFNSETIETANQAITALTSVDLSTGLCGFVVSAIFGSSNASNVARLDDFILEVI